MAGGLAQQAPAFSESITEKAHLVYKLSKAGEFVNRNLHTLDLKSLQTLMFRKSGDGRRVNDNDR